MRFLILFFLSFNAIAGVGGNQIIKQADFIEGLKSDKNFVKNASFEDTTYDSSWTITSGTQSLISSTPFGSNAIRVTASSQASVLQSNTGSGSSQAGLNCLVSAFIKTSLSSVRLCAIHNGTLNTNLCVNVNSNNTWAHYQVPTVCDGTSTVARIEMSSSGSGSFDVDNIFVGVNSNISNINATTSWVDYGTISIGGTTTAPTKGTTSIDNVKCRYVGEDAECDYTYRQTSGGVNGSGDYLYSLPTGFTFDLSKNPAYTGSNLNTLAENSILTATGKMTEGATNTTGFYAVVYSSTQFRIWPAGSTTNYVGTSFFNMALANLSMRMNIKFKAANNPSLTIVSTNNQDYDWTAYTPTITGFGTATNIAFYHKRQGSDLLIRGRFTSGTTTATEARVSLPSGLTSSSAITTLEIIGDMVASTTDAPSFHTLIEPSVTYFTFGRQVSPDYAGLAKRNGSQMATNGAGYSLFARIPIQGWNNNNVIVGTFAGVGNIKGLNKSVNEVMFGFGTTTQYTRCTASPCTIFENGSTFNISVTRSTTGLYQIVFPSDFSPTVKPKCWLTGKESSVSRAGYCGYQSTNPTSTTINLECRDGTGNINDVYMDVFCKGY